MQLAFAFLKGFGLALVSIGVLPFAAVKLLVEYLSWFINH